MSNFDTYLRPIKCISSSVLRYPRNLASLSTLPWGSEVSGAGDRPTRFQSRNLRRLLRDGPTSGYVQYAYGQNDNLPSVKLIAGNN
jgi:hypothetical protein